MVFGIWGTLGVGSPVAGRGHMVCFCCCMERPGWGFRDSPSEVWREETEQSRDGTGASVGRPCLVRWRSQGCFAGLCPLCPEPSVGCLRPVELRADGLAFPGAIRGASSPGNVVSKRQPLDFIKGSSGPPGGGLDRGSPVYPDTRSRGHR